VRIFIAGASGVIGTRLDVFDAAERRTPEPPLAGGAAVTLVLDDGAGPDTRP
jgi:hypothetical protein